MRDLGYLGDGSAFTDRRDLLLVHMTIASASVIEDQPFRLGPEVQREMAETLFALGPEWRQMLRAFSLPREAILLRRMADLLYAGCSQLRAACRLVGARPGAADRRGSREPLSRASTPSGGALSR